MRWSSSQGAKLTHSGDPRLAATSPTPYWERLLVVPGWPRDDQHAPRRIDAGVAAVMAHGGAAALAGTVRDNQPPGAEASGPGASVPGAAPDRAEGLPTTRSTGPTAFRGGPSTTRRTSAKLAALPGNRRTPPAVVAAEGAHTPLALQAALRGRQALRRQTAAGSADRMWRPAGRPRPSHARYRFRA